MKKVLFLLLILSSNIAYAGVDDFLPIDEKDNDNGKALVTLVRIAMECELDEKGKGSLDSHEKKSQVKEVRQSHPAEANLESSNFEESQERSVFFGMKQRLFGEETFLLECTKGTLERCVKGIDKFLTSTNNDCEELYSIGQKISYVLVDRAIFGGQTDEDKGIISQLTIRECKELESREAATLKLHRFIQMIVYFETSSPGIIDEPFKSEKNSLKASEPFHFERAIYREEKGVALTPDNLSLCFHSYSVEFMERLCALMNGKMKRREIDSVLQCLINGYPTYQRPPGKYYDLSLDYMYVFANSDAVQRYLVTSVLDFSSWIEYIRKNTLQLNPDSKLKDLFDYQSFPAKSRSTSLTMSSEQGVTSPPLSPKAKDKDSRASLIKSVKKTFSPKITKRASSAQTLEVPTRTSLSISPRSPTSSPPRSPKKESSPPRSPKAERVSPRSPSLSLTSSLREVFMPSRGSKSGDLTKSSDDVVVPKSPTFKVNNRPVLTESAPEILLDDSGVWKNELRRAGVRKVEEVE